MSSLGRPQKGKEMCFQIGLKTKALLFYWHQNYLENLLGREAPRSPTSKFLSGRKSHVAGRVGEMDSTQGKKLGERKSDN